MKANNILRLPLFFTGITPKRDNKKHIVDQMRLLIDQIFIAYVVYTRCAERLGISSDEFQ